MKGFDDNEAVTVEKRRYIEWTGRDPGEIMDHVERFGIPLRESRVDVAKLARWIHDYFGGDVTSLALQGTLKDRLTAEQIQKTQLENEKRRIALEVSRHNYLPREDIVSILWVIAGMFRELGERLGRDFGSDAQDNVFETLDEVERQIALLVRDGEQ
ncbi:MAG: hypothetical protein AAF497_00900 [Planctomycetota bacterium]